MIKKRTPNWFAKVLFALTVNATPAQRDELIRVYLEYLKAERATHMLPKILALYTKKMDAHEGVIRATITTAHAQDTDVVKKISQLMGDNVVVTTAVDPTLIGGFLLQTETHRFDGTLAQTLSALHASLVS